MQLSVVYLTRWGSCVLKCEMESNVANSHQIAIYAVSILELAVKFTYKVPSFSVLYVDLRQVKIQITKDDGSVLLFDGFIIADLSLERMPVPFSVVCFAC